MSRTKKTLLAVLVLAFAITSAGNAGWAHFTNTVRIPDGNLAHATQLLHTVVLGTDLESVQACVDYSRDTDKPKQGRLLATALFTPPDGEAIEVDFAGGVADNGYSNCKKIADLPAGTIGEFLYDFRSMPRLFGKKGQYSDVRSMVFAGEPEVDILGIAPAAEEDRGRILSASSVFTPDKVSQKHPVQAVQAAVTNRLLLEPSACISYAREADGKRNKGRVVAEMTVTYPDGEVEEFKFAGGVRNGEFVRCKELSRDAPVGTMFETVASMLGMPKLTRPKTNIEYVRLNSSLSTAGDVAHRRRAAETPDDDGGGNNPPPPPPGDTSQLSAADQRCISRVLYAKGPGARQIVRPRNNRGGRIEVFGPNSKVVNGEIVLSTVGWGATYAAACNDYERKRGNLGPEGPALSARDIKNFVWYYNMNSSGGPTAVRRDPRGGYHGDWYRPHLGVVIVSASSPSDAIEKMIRAGL